MYTYLGKQKRTTIETTGKLICRERVRQVVAQLRLANIAVLPQSARHSTRGDRNFAKICSNPKPIPVGLKDPNLKPSRGRAFFFYRI